MIFASLSQRCVACLVGVAAALSLTACTGGGVTDPTATEITTPITDPALIAAEKIQDKYNTGKSHFGPSSTVEETGAALSSPESSFSMTATAPLPATVTIKNVFETVDYPTAPKRVVAMGQMAVDNLLSLGIKPIIIMGSSREKDIPWQTPLLGPDVKFFMTATWKDIPYEQVAAAHPDFIVGDVWRITDDVYFKLKKIAPTLGPLSYKPTEIGWKNQLPALSTIFYGNDNHARKVIDEDAALFAAARKEMPGLAGKYGVASQYISAMKSFGIIAQPMIPGNSFFIDLGMKIPDAVINAPNQIAGRATVSAENVNLLQSDFLLIGPEGGSIDDIRAIPGFTDLKAVKSGAFVLAPMEYDLQAVNQPTALSRAYTLKKFHPQLEIAATTPAS